METLGLQIDGHILTPICKRLLPRRKSKVRLEKMCDVFFGWQMEFILRKQASSTNEFFQKIEVTVCGSIFTKTVNVRLISSFMFEPNGNRFAFRIQIVSASNPFYIFSKNGTSTKSIAIFITASVLSASASRARASGFVSAPRIGQFW